MNDRTLNTDRLDRVACLLTKVARRGFSNGTVRWSHGYILSNSQLAEAWRFFESILVYYREQEQLCSSITMLALTRIRKITMVGRRFT